jgi:alanine dehydrogenase
MVNVESRASFILTASDVRKYLTVERCIDAVEQAFALLGSGAVSPPATLGVHVNSGGFHLKAGTLDLGRSYFAAKTNGNFPANPRARGLPTIQGVVVLADATNGSVLAIVDSVELTAKRTAAATAVAARRLAHADSSVVAIVGCGFQAYYQIEALKAVRPVERVVAVDTDRARAEALAAQVSDKLQIECSIESLSDAAADEPHIWVTCSTSTEFFLFPQHVSAGAFVAGVGVDNESKRELAPALLERAHVVADLAEQCAKIGDLHHALAAGAQPLSVTELKDIVTGQHVARTGERDIRVFDSTGIGLQDVAACAAVFEAAVTARANGAEIMSVELSS